MLSFAFGGNTGETPESLKRKREMAEALLSGNGRAPQNIGEGLNAIGQAIRGRGIISRANKAQEAGQADAASAFAPIQNALFGGQQPQVQQTTAPVNEPPAQGGNFIRDLFSGRSNEPQTPVNPANGAFGEAPDNQASLEQAVRETPQLRALFSTDTRAVHRPSSDFTNISLDFNAATPDARGTESIIPDNASPEIRQAATNFNQDVVNFAKKHGIEQPNRGVKTRSQNGRGVSNTVHLEPFFNGNIELQNVIRDNIDEFSQIVENNFGGLENARVIAPHGIGRDRGATSDVFTDETTFGTQVIQSILDRQGRGGSQQQPQREPQVAQAPQETQNDFRSPGQQRQQSGVNSVNNEQLFAVINNPFASRSQVSVAQTILNQRLAADAPLTRAQQGGFNRQDRDFQFRNSEAQRDQSNTDRTFNAGRGDRANDVEFRNVEVGRNQFNTNRAFDAGREDQRTSRGFDERRLNLSEQAARREQEAFENQQREAQLKRDDLTSKANSRDDARRSNNQGILDDVNKVLRILDDDSNILPETGLFSGPASFINPNTDARALRDVTDGIVADLSFSQLQALRENSPTGAALGQTSDRDLQLLADAAGKLNPSGNPRVFRENLERIRDQYDNLLQFGTLNAPQSPQQELNQAQSGALDAARAAIQAGAPREAVLKRLRENGLSVEGL